MRMSIVLAALFIATAINEKFGTIKISTEMMIVAIVAILFCIAGDVKDLMK